MSEKVLEDFYNGQNKCKDCTKRYYNTNKEKISQYKKQYREKNKERISERDRLYREKNKPKNKIDKVCRNDEQYIEKKKQKKSDCNKRYREKNRQKVLEAQKQYREKNREYLSEKSKEYSKLNRDSVNNYIKKRAKKDPIFKFKRTIRRLVCTSFKRNKNNFSKSISTEQILGCTIEQFRDYVSLKFIDGMRLDNHGEWHLDHIIPLATTKTEEDIIKLNHYTNFQPLWAIDNLKKGSKIIK
jgi:hypothetical protein